MRQGRITGPFATAGRSRAFNYDLLVRRTELHNIRDVLLTPPLVRENVRQMGWDGLHSEMKISSVELCSRSDSRSGRAWIGENESSSRFPNLARKVLKIPAELEGVYVANGYVDLHAVVDELNRDVFVRCNLNDIATGPSPLQPCIICFVEYDLREQKGLSALDL